MPRKAYIADLKRLSIDSGVDGIFDVRSGDDDGEFCFKVAAEANGSLQLHDISALIPDVSEYPDGHEFHIFVADDNAPSHVGVTLNRLPETMGLSLSQLLEVVSKAFSSDGDGDHQMADSQFNDVESEEEYEESDEEDAEDDFFGGDGKAATTGAQATASTFAGKSQSTTEFRARIRSDLNHVKAAGFKIGHQGPLLDGASSYVSISCRVAKLGISEEAMQAWQLEPDEYLILIMHYPSGYKSVDHLKGWDASSARRNIGFRVGVSHTYKPTLKEAISAFTKLSVEEETKAEAMQAKADATSGTTRGLRNVFISRPLNELLNERLPTVLKYRYIGMNWRGAEEFYNDHQGKTFTMTGNDYMDNKYMQEEPVHPLLPSLVTSDHMNDSSEPHSFPLMAMQFLLRHFVRCTEFCLVCHCKLEDDLEALKPYVCDKPLCLYQYMSLGFGPSIEHEIISQPYVVDLLISFCYQSAVTGRLGSFPTGLGLNVPSSLLITEFQTSIGRHNYGQQVTPAVTPGPAPSEGHLAKFNRGTLEILFEKGTPNPVKLGDWLVIPDPEDQITTMHCRVVEIHMFPVVRVTEPIIKAQATAVAPYGNPQPAAPLAPAPKPDSIKKKEFTFEDVKFNIYDVNFDDLTEAQKRGAIINQLDLLPGVIEIKEYLTRNRMATLATWAERISPTASGILRWIIASNRACIVQVDDLDQPDKLQADKKGEERLGGMDGWMQFRFAMGAPDKERRFMSCVQETKLRLNLSYPTIFAWHGSPAGNWHGIIREGLHFKDALHGRAYGNGCYHSLDFNTSLGYSGANFHSSYHNSGTWPSSALKMSSALALNEIVNAPAEYVSRSPHLVVAQLDWIQTRYLFVQCGGDMKAAMTSKPIAEVHIQDPSMTPNGPKNKIVIPMSAMPKNRRGDKQGSKSKGKRKLGPKGTAFDPIPIDCDDDAASVDTDIEDLNILIEQEIQLAPKQLAPTVNQTLATSGKGKENGLFSGLKSFVREKVTPPKTDFVPGTLDYSRLPLLGEPVWSTGAATKRLQKEYQALLKVQDSHPLHELGWYTDPSQFNNVYQWIFEMHSFEPQLPLARQMKDKKIKSVVMEMRFGPDYPMSPPFIRVIRPRFLNFQAGGGGHVTAGGSICMELLTNSGWSAVMSMESVLLQVHLAMSSTDPRPAQLDTHSHNHDYGVGEAVEAYVRACAVHGWAVPPGFREMAYGGASTSRY